jgi:8-oxo-dGTP pyrophosphatase MutT (NUDIX family)
MFENIVDSLKVGFSKELPGQDAQYKMVPPGRGRTKLNGIQGFNPRRAAVLCLVYPKDDAPHIVLMRRNSYPGVHSDQISFPGGKAEAFDNSLQDTAVRESHEELGIVPESVNLLGELTQVYIPPSNFLVNPFVGFTESQPQFIPDSKEVNEVVEVPFEAILDDKNLQNVSLDLRGTPVDVPAFMLNGHVVWGATAMMLSELAHIVR